MSTNGDLKNLNAAFSLLSFCLPNIGVSHGVATKMQKKTEDGNLNNLVENLP